VPAADPDQAHHGSFCAVQLGDGSAGVAYVRLGDARSLLLSGEPQRMAGREALTLAEGLEGDDPGARPLALAALNALSRHLFDRAGFVPDLATNSLGSLELEGDDRLGMVGFFPPLVRRAREQGIPLLVLELKSELVQDAPGLTVTLDPARLGECTKVICTSTTLLNDSLESLLAHAGRCRQFVVVGPSAGGVPDPLFDRGVTAVGGTWVRDASMLLARMERGERWGDAASKSSLRRDPSWPGFEELLRRAAR
jgi:uncharacterized protein (DUF4213/DUF364 family)